MTPSVRITPRALADLKAIARYSLGRWGRDQRDAYLRGLAKRFDWLAAHPLGGRARADIAEGYRSFPEGAHIIFYIARDDGIDVIAVVHQAMDVDRQFGG